MELGIHVSLDSPSEFPWGLSPARVAQGGREVSKPTFREEVLGCPDTGPHMDGAARTSEIRFLPGPEAGSPRSRSQ